MTTHCPTCGQRLGPGEWGLCAGCGWECAGCGRTVDEVSPGEGSGEGSGLCVSCHYDGGDDAA